MANLAEDGERCRADAFRRAVVAHEIGERGLQRLVPLAQFIVCGVCYLGRVLAVIEVVVARDLDRKPGELGARLLLGQILWIARERARLS